MRGIALNKWLLRILVLSVFSIFSIKFLWSDTPEWWRYGSETGDIVFSLAASFIAAFIFYVIDIWIPEKNRNQKINERISIPLNRLLASIEIPIVHVIEKSSGKGYDINTITEVQLLECIGEMDLVNDVSPLRYFDIDRDIRYTEYFCKHINDSKKFIKQINELPNLDFDLVLILDKIRNSSYQELMEQIENASNSSRIKSIHGNTISRSLYEYLQLYLVLSEYKTKNKI